MLEVGGWDSLPQAVAYTLLVLGLMWLVSRLVTVPSPPVRLRQGKGSHRWLSSHLVTSPLHCNSCSSLLLTATAHCCTVCGAASCATSLCVRNCDRKTPCKTVSRARSEEEAKDKASSPPRHRWIQGNLSLGSLCCVCEEPAGDGPGLRDLRCVWCQRKLHTDCKQHIQEDACDLGRHSNLILAPERVITNHRDKVIGLLPSPDPAFHPLIVVANNKAGNSDGATVMAGFRRHLNPAQVVDLSERRMEDALSWCNLASPTQCYVLVCGGDGTIGWVLNTVDKMKLATPPAIAIFPLGTGNDLARTLGYGSGTDSSEDISEAMARLENAKLVNMDRWRVEVTPKRHLRIRLPRTTILMNNYLSIGVDALVTYNFHKARESPFYLISSRIINKLIYFSYGTKDVLERQCQNLNKKIELYMDGKRIELPELESVVVLNIPYWGAGVRPWDLGTGHSLFPHRPSIEDRKLEVFGVFSSFHIAQMQVGLSEPHRIGQAMQVKIKLLDSAPMQIDGEPWEQHPAEISLTHSAQVPMLQVEDNIQSS